MSAVDPEESRLARESRAGSTEAFERLIDLHHDRLFAFMMSLTRHRHDAEDLTQQTFIRAWQKIHRFNPDRPLLPWLFTIGRRLSLRMLRKNRPLPMAETLVVDPSTPSLDLWQLAEKRLSRDAFSAIWMHYHDGFSLAEVGRVLGKREGTVKVLLHRARTTLAEGMSELRPAVPPPLPSSPPPLPSLWKPETTP